MIVMPLQWSAACWRGEGPDDDANWLHTGPLLRSSHALRGQPALSAHALKGRATRKDIAHCYVELQVGFHINADILRTAQIADARRPRKPAFKARQAGWRTYRVIARNPQADTQFSYDAGVTAPQVPTELFLRVLDEPDRGAEWTDAEAVRLTRDLRDACRITISGARNSDGATGARGAGAEIIGTVVALLPTVQYLTPLFDTVLAWLTERRRRRVHVKLGDDEITLDGAQPDEARKLIRAFIARTSRLTRPVTSSAAEEKPE